MIRRILLLLPILLLLACGDGTGSNGGRDRARISTTVMEDGPDMLKFGHVNLAVPADSFLKVFELGDLVTVELKGVLALEAPAVGDYDDVSAGEFLLRVVPGKPYLTLAVNYGQLAVSTGIADGKLFPIDVEIAMKEKGGYLENLRMREFQNSADSIGAYPDLTPAEFANFREIRTTGMGAKRLYRSSSPISPEMGRNAVADSLAREAGIAAFVNLSDTREEGEAYEGYASSYYATRKIAFLGLPAAFASDAFKKGFAEGLRFVAENDGPYLVHCVLGKDRAGFASAVLEALMGASAAEIEDDYARTYSNYYNVIDGRQQAPAPEHMAWYRTLIVKNLRMAYGAEGIDLSDFESADLAAATERYLKALGLSEAEISALKAKLGD